MLNSIKDLYIDKLQEQWLGFFAIADVVDESHEESEAEEAARGKDEEKHAIGTTNEVDAEETSST